MFAYKLFSHIFTQFLKVCPVKFSYLLEFQLFLNAIYYGDLIIILMIKHEFSEL